MKQYAKISMLTYNVAIVRKRQFFISETVCQTDSARMVAIVRKQQVFSSEAVCQTEKQVDSCNCRCTQNNNSLSVKQYAKPKNDVDLYSCRCT